MKSLGEWLRTYPEFKPLVWLLVGVGGLVMTPAVMLLALLGMMDASVRWMLMLVCAANVVVGASITWFCVAWVHRYLNRYASAVDSCEKRQITATLERVWGGKNSYVRLVIDGSSRRPVATTAKNLVVNEPWKRGGTLHLREGKPFLFTFDEHRVWVRR